ncbi:cilia- and flagella-associated protein 53-like [Etheostoma spectabile]|uniref:cilia- and flagella-associated protein 53-like n=1 Tax=Etheostoma spectabile TaxID=54343 RepID=UPI0013AE94E2|nr:cilia- and flagella-associated protein 53-like [Etheostoma spectabile]
MQQKDICTAPHITQACEEVEASSQHAMTVDPELTTLKEKNEALRSSLQQASCEKEESIKLKEENEALRSSLQQASFKKEESIKLKEENKALTAEVEQLKEELKENYVLHDEVNQKNVKKISDLEVQLLFKTASEDNTRHEKEQMEEALQRQKESQKETEVYLAEQREENHELMVKLAQALSNLESQQLQWQEERTRLLQSLSDIQDTLQETTCSGVKEETDDQGEATLSQPKGNTKPKKPSLWRRFLRLFK